MSRSSKTSLPLRDAFYIRFSHLSTPCTKKFFVIVKIDNRGKIAYTVGNEQGRSWLWDFPGLMDVSFFGSGKEISVKDRLAQHPL